jgi:acetate kinase
MQHQAIGIADLEKLLYHECGLLGVSGISGDVEILSSSPELAAAEALDLFAFQVAKAIGALSATLGGLDRLVFTGGIGENAWAVRAAIMQRSAWLGIALDCPANRAGLAEISTDESPVRVEVIRTDEELVIARHVASLMKVV